MPEFAYTARNQKGERVNGEVDAANEREVLSILSGQALFPVEISAKTKSSGGFGGRRVNGQTMATNYSQLASLLRSGVPLLRSLRVLTNQSSNVALAEVLADVYTRVEDGATLADAMSRHPRVFREMAVSMVRAGGEGGFLEEALERVAAFTEQSEDLKSRTLGALAYPIFLGSVGTIVVFSLVTFFVPRFASMFDRLRERGELPAMTDWLMFTSDLMRNWGWIGAVALVLVGVALWPWYKSDDGRRACDRLKLRLPMIGGIFQNLAIARFCRVLGTLLRNGVPILKSLDISREAAGNRVLSGAIAEASSNISSGQALAAPLSSSGYFPVTVVEMITVAEESNTLDRVLVEIADGLEKRTWRRLDLMVRLLEPIMLLVLAGIVLVVVIALLLPVIKMSSSL